MTSNSKTISCPRCQSLVSCAVAHHTSNRTKAQAYRRCSSCKSYLRIQFDDDQVKTEAVSVTEIRLRAGNLLFGAAICFLAPVPLVLESITRIHRGEPYLLILILPVLITALPFGIAFTRGAVRLVKGTA
jgi:hypothetical protein